MTEGACAQCGHPEEAHLMSGPNATPWCRLCYGHPIQHRKRDHEYTAAGGH
jgi:hypothetical protein